MEGLSISFHSKSLQAPPKPESFVKEVYKATGIKAVCSWVDTELKRSFEMGLSDRKDATEEADNLRRHHAAELAERLLRRDFSLFYAWF